MTSELTDVFSDSKPEPKGVIEAAPAAKIPEPPSDEDEPEDDEGKETEADKAKVEPEPSDDTEEPSVIPVAALKDERSKRQAAESKAKELEKRLAQMEKGDKAEVEDVDDDAFKERAESSRETMMEIVTDYEEKEAIFLDLVKEDPTLAIQMRRSKSPAKFAYTKAKEHLEHKEFLEEKGSETWKEFQEFKKNPKKYAQKLAELEEKANAETPEAKRKKAALSVPNLNKAASAQIDPSKLKVSELDDILDGRPF